MEIFPWVTPEGKQVYADPLRVERRLTAACDGDVKHVLQLAQSENPMQAEQYTVAWLRAIAFAFGLRPFDEATGQGAGDEFLMSLYESYLDWKGKKKVTSGSTPSSPPTSPATSPPSAPTAAPASPTISASAYG